MRRLTSSGLRLTSTPSTVAVPDVGLNSPHIMRMVVDLPAPLAPRNPKISPRCDLEADAIDGGKAAEPARQIAHA